jgi:pimeloyl-ACP methyl ester carboxylesterase
MLNYTLYKHDSSEEWVTFVHGAGGSSSIWFKQIREYSKQYNVLLLDLRGHGDSVISTPNNPFDQKYTFESIAKDILQVLDFEQIQKSHFVGISLGTILIRQLAEMSPERVQSMILGGAIIKLNFRSQFLMRVGNLFKSIVPYIWIYKFFAFIIMPNKNHKESRLLFINEAKKLYQKEFIRWFKLTTEINPVLKWFRQVDVKIPTLYVMGEEDYMFLPSVQHVVLKHTTSRLVVVPNCGHVVNVEQPVHFNQLTLKFLKKQIQ